MYDKHVQLKIKISIQLILANWHSEISFVLKHMINNSILKKEIILSERYHRTKEKSGKPIKITKHKNSQKQSTVTTANMITKQK